MGWALRASHPAKAARAPLTAARTRVGAEVQPLGGLTKVR